MRQSYLHILSAIFILAGSAHAQVSSQAQDDLIDHLQQHKKLFSSVSAKVHEKIRVANEEKASTGQDNNIVSKLTRGVNYDKTSWGTVSGDRNYQWVWSDRQTKVGFIDPLLHEQSVQQTKITNSEKQYTLFWDTRTSKGGAGDINKLHGNYEMPSEFAYQLDGQWLADVLKRFEWKELRTEMDAKEGPVVILRASTAFGEIEIHFDVNKGYLPMKQFRTLHGKITEYRINSLTPISDVLFPTTMIAIQHSGITLDTPVVRTRTLNVSDLALNQVSEHEFQPEWREDMIVSDVEQNVLYKVVKGKLVKIGRIGERSPREMITGLAFICTFILVGLVLIRSTIRKRRIEDAPK